MDIYNRAMAELRSVSLEAAIKLERTKYQWAGSMFNSKNYSESMNAWAMEARYLSSIGLIDNTRIKIRRR